MSTFVLNSRFSGTKNAAGGKNDVTSTASRTKSCGVTMSSSGGASSGRERYERAMGPPISRKRRVPL